MILMVVVVARLGPYTVAINSTSHGQYLGAQHEVQQHQPVALQPGLVAYQRARRGSPPAADVMRLPLVRGETAHRRARLERRGPRLGQGGTLLAALVRVRELEPLGQRLLSDSRMGWDLAREW